MISAPTRAEGSSDEPGWCPRRSTTAQGSPQGLVSSLFVHGNWAHALLRDRRHLGQGRPRVDAGHAEGPDAARGHLRVITLAPELPGALEVVKDKRTREMFPAESGIMATLDANAKKQLGWTPKVNLKWAIKLTLDYHLAHKDYRLE